MQKILLAIVLLSSMLLAKVQIIVSIAPQESFTKAIGGELVAVTTMIPPGNSPHTYEPKPSQMRSVSKADIYFTIGVEFEKAWLEKFRAQNSKMEVINTTVGINKIPMQGHHHHGDEKEEHNSSLDPHVWLSPKNVAIIAKNIYEALIKADANNSAIYKKNYEHFLKEIEQTDATIRAILAKVPPKTKFMVFHPSWGYFAKEYNLVQIAIEVEGKEPKPRELAHLIKEAKEEQVKVIFASLEFSDKTAKLIAKELGVPVVKVSPLDPQWSKNLINFAKAIAGAK